MLRRLFTQKRSILVIAVIAVLVMLLLATGLHDVNFREGSSLWWGKTELPQTFANDFVRELVDVPLWKQGVFWALTAILVILLAFLLSPEVRKRFIRAILSFLLTVFVLSYLLENNLIHIPEIEPAVSAEQGDNTEDLLDLPPAPVFSPPELPAWANFLVSLGAVFVFLGLAWALVRWWQRFNRVPPAGVLKDLASIARSSLDDISAGNDWADAITNCYVRMSEVVSDKRGLVRQETMTPTEFARRLERAGLPGDPVRRLTRLFESVRYGAHKPARDEINEAVACLNAILHHCGVQV